MVKWLKRLWCWLTGGCRYRTIDLHKVYVANDSAPYYGRPLYGEKINLRKKDGEDK